MAGKLDQHGQRRAALGEHIRAACERRWGTEAEAVRHLPIARETLRRIWRGAPSSPKTHIAIERAFGWPTGSVRRYLEDGGELPGSGQPEVVGTAFIIDTSRITRDEAVTLLWSVTSASTGIERLRELRRIEDEVMNELS